MTHFKNYFTKKKIFLKLQGSSLNVNNDEAKVRPLANMNYKNAEEKYKLRNNVGGILYSGLLTSRSNASNEEGRAQSNASSSFRLMGTNFSSLSNKQAN